MIVSRRQVEEQTKPFWNGLAEEFVSRRQVDP
jgi:hypothetical protein